MMPAQSRKLPLPRAFYLGVAYVAVALAAIGVVLPLLPTTPFLLLAAWAATRGSPRVHAWLYRHRMFGPLLRDWEQQRAIPRRAKLIACALLMLSWLVMVAMIDRPWLLGSASTVLAVVAVFIVSRPQPRAQPCTTGACHADR